MGGRKKPLRSRRPISRPSFYGRRRRDSHRQRYCMLASNGHREPELHNKQYRQRLSGTHRIELSTLPAGHPARGYKDIADLISISNYGKSDIAMLNGKRIIVPFPARQIIIKELHRSHSGLTKTFKTASQLYFWPGMKNELRQTIDTCTVCGEDRPAQPRPTGNCFPPSKAT